MKVSMPSGRRNGGVAPSTRAGRLTLAVALLASLLALLPNLGGARAATLPPLAWGNNDHAQPGRCETASSDDRWNPRCLNPTFSATPFEVAGLGDLTQFSAGPNHNLAVQGSDGSVWAWGRNAENQLGDGESLYPSRGSPAPNNYPSPPDRPGPGQVFQRTETLRVPPGTDTTGSVFNRTYDVGPIEPLTGVKAVAAGGYHSLAVKNNGTVWAWGENECGQLGNGKTYTIAGGNAAGAQNLSPPAAVEVHNLSNITAVAAGRGHSLALDGNGVLWAWGDNRWGQLGNSGTNQQAGDPPLNAVEYDDCKMPDDDNEANPYSGRAQIVPTMVPIAGVVVAIAAGSDHSLALTDDGTVWSWGNNCSAQLGSSTGTATASRSVPAPVLGLPGDPV